MSIEATMTTCFLCGSVARYVETDGGNRRFYQCSNEDCGDYEISLCALSRLADEPAKKRQAMKQAKRYRATGKAVEIIVGVPNRIVKRPVERHQIR